MVSTACSIMCHVSTLLPWHQSHSGLHRYIFFVDLNGSDTKKEKHLHNMLKSPLSTLTTYHTSSTSGCNCDIISPPNVLGILHCIKCNSLPPKNLHSGISGPNSSSFRQLAEKTQSMVDAGNG